MLFFTGVGSAYSICGLVFGQIWQVISHHFSDYFSSLIHSLLSFWESSDTNVSSFIIIP